MADVEAMQADVVNGKTAKPRTGGRGGVSTGGAGVAPRVVSTLQSVLGHAKHKGLLKEHPTKGARKLATNKKKRRLSVTEIEDLGAAMMVAERHGENPVGIAIIKLLLLTGFRRQEGQAMRRDWLNGEGGYVAWLAIRLSPSASEVRQPVALQALRVRTSGHRSVPAAPGLPPVPRSRAPRSDTARIQAIGARWKACGRRRAIGKLQRILGVTDAFNSTLFWHTMYFARIPDRADHGVAERIRLTRDYERSLTEKVPNFHQGHPMHAEEVEEEYVLTEHSFRCQMFGVVMNLPRYFEWSSRADMTPTYDYLLLQLKYLQWQFGGKARKPWLLKSPLHMGFESQLARIFPQGIRIITPHRDPADMIPSVAYTSWLFQKLWRGDVPLDRQMGQFLLEAFSIDVPRFLKWRAENSSLPVLDLAYRDIAHDSLKTAQQVFDFVGIAFTDDARTQIAKWDERNPLHKHGTPPASLDLFKLSRQEVDAKFADYNRTFREFI